MSDRGGTEVPGAEVVEVEHFTEDDIITPELNINDVTIPRRSNRVGSLTSAGREYQQGLAIKLFEIEATIGSAGARDSGSASAIFYPRED